MSLSSPHRLCALLVLLGLAGSSPAAERVTLTNGFAVDCLRHEPAGDRLRLFLPSASASGDPSYMEVAATAVAAIEPLPESALTHPDAPVHAVAAVTLPGSHAAALGTRAAATSLSAAEMRPLLEHAGQAHRIDADLLASIVRAESGGHPHAVSRTGARGLMQLMPATAASVGVSDAFEPEQNINGGTAYLDGLLTRYHDNIALAAAAYNAGPGAVDRWHGVPPYRETRDYVARVIREFNRRKLAAARPSLQAGLR